MDTQIEKLLLQPEKPNSTLEIFIASNELAEKSNLGKLFIMFEINSKERGLSEKINHLTTLIQNDYYSSPIPNVEKSLETTCQNLNLNLPDIISKPEIWYKKVNILVGVINDKILTFAQMGSFSGFLIRHNKITQILNTQKGGNGPENFFSQITTGEIKPNDVIILSDYTLFDFFSLEKIKKIATKFEPHKTIKQIKGLISENERIPSILSLIIKCEEKIIEQEMPNNDTKKYLQNLYGSKESMQQLENLKQRTRRTLTSSMLPSLKKMKKNLKLKLKKNEKKHQKELKLPDKKRTSSTLKKTNQLSLKPRVLNVNILKFKLPKFEKINVKIIVILIVVFISSLIYLSYYQKIKKINEHNQKIISEIKNKKDEAESSLIYKDKEKANLLLNESLGALKKLTTNKKKWQTIYQFQLNDITQLLNKINDIYQAKISETTNLTNISIKKIISNHNDNLFYLLTTEGNLYKFENNAPKLYINNQNIVDVSFLEKNKGIIYLTKDNKFFISKNNKQKELNITLLEDAIPQNIMTYGERIYFVDKLHGIYKITSPLSANPQMSVWYSADKNLINQTKQIFIDGNVWVNSLNKITKLYRGKKSNFNISKLNKDLGNNILLYTQENWGSLYIIDKDNNRLIIISKEGNTQKQFLNNQLSQVNSFIINQDETEAIINIGDKILKLNLNTE